MPTCREVITRAFRKARVYGTGETPTSDDMDDALDELRNFYEQAGTNGLFGRLTDTLQTADYEAAPFERIQISGGTVTLPTELEEDEELPPHALSFIEVIDTDASTVTRYLYENGAWVDINNLTLDDEAPLASRGMAGLAACLAMSMEEWGGLIGPSIVRQAASFKTGIALKLGSDSRRSGQDYF